MSSRAQIHVTPKPKPPERVTTIIEQSAAISPAELLGDQGAARLDGLLERLPELIRDMEPELRRQFDWGKEDEKVWLTRIEGVEVRLDLRRAAAFRSIHGSVRSTPAERRDVERRILEEADRRLNQLFALAVAEQMSERMTGYVRARAKERVPIGARTRVHQRVQMRAINVNNLGWSNGNGHLS